MTSRKVAQSVNEYVGWEVTNTNTQSYQKDIRVPFSVDEIRVAQALVVTTTQQVTNSLTQVVVSSKNLVGSSGVLSILRGDTIQKLWDLAVPPVQSRTNVSSSMQVPIPGARYVFPSSHRKNVNGTFVFTVTDIDGNAFDMSLQNDFEVSLMLEFIQYEEEDKVKLDTDLQQILKSGRRRL